MPASWASAPSASAPSPRPDRVPRYYLHLRHGEGPGGLAEDLEGDEVASDGPLLRAHVAGTARDLMRNARLDAIPDWRECAFEVADEAGRTVLTLPFREVAAA